MKKTGLKWERGKIILQNFSDNIKITAFGEDPAGELYVLTNNDNGPGSIKGRIYKIANN
ncbi:MAG: hypothetical protein WKG06_41245 [Segetibacter sp.]